MDNLNDIKQIWLSTDVTGLPDASDVVKTIKRYRFNHFVKNVAFIVFALFLVGVMCDVLITYKSHFISTRIGEACFFIALFIILSANAGSLKRITAQKNFSNESFINFLKQEQLRQLAFQKRTQVIGFVLASSGLLLYIFEEVHTDNLKMAIAYLLTIAWIVFCWFIIRSISIKRKAKKMSKTIKNLEKISTQFLNH